MREREKERGRGADERERERDPAPHQAEEDQIRDCAKSAHVSDDRGASAP